MPMQNPNVQAQPDQSTAGGSGIIQNLDELLGAVSEGMAGRPELMEIAKRMASLRQEFRSLMTEASKIASGGAQAGGKGMGMPSMPGSVPPMARMMMDQSHGMPQNPAGNY